MKYLLLFVLLLSVSCAAQNIDNLIGPGQPEPYRVGFGDGYGSGKKSEGSLYDKFRKDVYRFSQDELYRQGWQDGFEMGKGKWQEVKRYSRY